MGLTIQKIMLLTLALLTWTTACGQSDPLTGTWITSAGEVMKIYGKSDKDHRLDVLATLTSSENVTLHILGDTLSFQSSYRSSAENYKILHLERYDLVIVRRSDTILTVKPVSGLAIDLFNKRETLHFIRQEFNRDRGLVFNKLVYHTTTCFGSCPVIDLEIDDKRNIYLSGRFFKDHFGYEVDSTQSGQFVGKVEEKLYHEFIALLQSCTMQTLHFPKRDGADAPVTTLIIYVNGQRKYFKSMFPPVVAHELIRFLYTLRGKINLTRTSEKRMLEV